MHSFVRGDLIAPRGFLDCPYEVRAKIYDLVGTPFTGSRAGVLHILLLNKQIASEAREVLYNRPSLMISGLIRILQIFDNIPHTFVIADATCFSWDAPADFLGTPHRIEEYRHPGSIKRLVIILSIGAIGKMAPDAFKVMISVNGKTQIEWLPELIGMWPNIRKIPLEQIRLEFQASSLPSHEVGYPANLDRLIRTFKRTRVWAETGDCSSNENGSFLLPLTRAFNQARRYWVKEANFKNRKVVRYDKHELEEGQHEKVQNRRKIEPSNKTSTHYTSKVREYVKSKMVQKILDGPDLTCEKCLAHFDDRKEYHQHLQRGKWRR
jgi:hypothetical protein